MNRIVLTARQGKVLRAIERWIAREGYAPSYIDLKVAVGVSSQSLVHNDVDVLAARGLVLRNAGVARSLRLTDAGKRVSKGVTDGATFAHADS